MKTGGRNRRRWFAMVRDAEPAGRGSLTSRTRNDGVAASRVGSDLSDPMVVSAKCATKFHRNVLFSRIGHRQTIRMETQKARRQN